MVTLFRYIFHTANAERYSLYINCGGDEIKVGKTTYERDMGSESPAIFYPTQVEWGFSSTGDWWGATTINENNYTVNNSSVIAVPDAELYTEARSSPISLTCYGRCLAKGNYTVILHFAEIIFRDDNSFYSLGSRVFDVYIQVRNCCAPCKIFSKFSRTTNKGFI